MGEGMGESQIRSVSQIMELADIETQQFEEDDGRVRTGNVLTAAARITSSVIGVGVLTLSWAMAGLGWLLSALLFTAFCCVIIYTSHLLSQCYRSTQPVNGNKRNSTYMDAVRSILGDAKFKICGLVHCVKFVGAVIGYTTAASKSTMSIQRSICYQKSSGIGLCHASSVTHVIGFGVAQMILSQFHGFQNLWWPPILAGLMSSTYVLIGLGLSIAKVASTGSFKGSLTGLSIGVAQDQKTKRILLAVGSVAFAYSHPVIFFEIQDTIKSPPSETRTMQKATLISYTIITFVYVVCGSFGYAAFGDSTPENLLSSFVFHNPFWLLDIANAAVLTHLIVAYQGYSHTLFAFIEKEVAAMFPNCKFITKELQIRIPGFSPYKLNLFRLAGRTSFVLITTLISLLIPFFNTVVGLLGALGFWPLTVYFPVEMYISQKRIQKWSIQWIGLQILSLACLVISVAAAIGSVAGVVDELKSFKPFHQDLVKEHAH